MIKKKFVFALCFSLMCVGFAFNKDSAEAKKNYTVSPATKVLGKYAKSKDLNRHTKHYFMLRYYMDELEKNGGGTLTLKKGTYSITNILYVPSNVTIRMKDGARIVKSGNVGNAGFRPAEGIFQVVPYRLSQTKRKGKGYSGSRNVKFIGEGKATIDLKYVKNSKAIVTAHCQNVEIRGIRFLNMNAGHFLEVDATKKLTVKDCKFSGVASGSPYTKEAINIDVPDPNTGGVNLQWSSLDKTPDTDITIEDCTFSDLQRGVGSHKYSQKKAGGNRIVNCYHENVVIRNNTFTNMKDTGIFMLNWKNVTLEKNVFENCNLCLNFRGTQAPVNLIQNHFGTSEVVQTFSGQKQRLYYMAYKSPGKGSCYEPVFNQLGFETLQELLDANNAQAE